MLYSIQFLNCALVLSLFFFFLYRGTTPPSAERRAVPVVQVYIYSGGEGDTHARVKKEGLWRPP